MGGCSARSLGYHCTVGSVVFDLKWWLMVFPGISWLNDGDGRLMGEMGQITMAHNVGSLNDGW